MNEKIEIMGISLDTCSVEEIIESINVHWLQEESAYGGAEGSGPEGLYPDAG